ncbi:MAG TPA: RNHCP domain-containing protein [Candidatus Paceibacterota bacterium]
MTKKFTRTIEDFVCEKCGTQVSGNGYTNHCPKCLWSKHVDVNPGDRKGECGGLMEPFSVSKKEGEYVLQHRCGICGFERKNRLLKEDNFDAVLSLGKTI